MIIEDLFARGSQTAKTECWERQLSPGAVLYPELRKLHKTLARNTVESSRITVGEGTSFNDIGTSVIEALKRSFDAQQFKEIVSGGEGRDSVSLRGFQRSTRLSWDLFWSSHPPFPRYFPVRFPRNHENSRCGARRQTGEGRELRRDRVYESLSGRGSCATKCFFADKVLLMWNNSGFYKLYFVQLIFVTVAVLLLLLCDPLELTP